MTGLRFSKLVLVVNAGVPLALLAWDVYRGRVGADPVNYAIKTTGLLALIFLVLSLSVTPARRLTRWNPLVGFRRSLGLYAFAYAAVHLGIYVAFEQAGSVAGAASEIWARRYLQVGFAGVFLMLPLAVTSTDGMIRRLGPRRWKALHRLAYVAAAAGALHYYMQAKSDVRQPLVFGGVLAGLLLARAVWHYADLRRAAAANAGRPRPAAAAAVSAAAAPPAAGRRFWSGELTVVRTFDETPDVRTFRLAPAGGGELPFDYLPGQYLTLRQTVDGRPVNRSYTIASSPTRRGYCELTVKREAMGASSGRLHREVRPGDRLTVAAPAGRFMFTGAEPADAAGVVLVAGGVGITPLMSIVRYLTDRSWPGDVYLVVAARDEPDVIFADEIAQLVRRFPNVRACVTLSRAGDAWVGRRGRVTAALLAEFVPDLPRRQVYVCGPDAMMAATVAILADLGVPAGNVKTEAFAAAAAPSQLAEADAMPPADDAVMTPAAGATGAGVVPGARTVTFATSARAAPIADGVTVLEAAEAAGVDIPFECRAGVCGQCKTRLVSGTVTMDSEEALSRSEKAAGWVLACQARAGNGDLVVKA